VYDNENHLSSDWLGGCLFIFSNESSSLSKVKTQEKYV